MRKWLVIFISSILMLHLSFAEAAEPKKWTFIVYLNGNNSLDRFGALNIIDMEKVGSNDEVNIVVQWASEASRKAVRMLVLKSKDDSKVTSPIIEDLGLVDMGDYHTLEAFIKWSVEHYPADHYFIDVWNHGGGWRKKGFSRDISWDDISGNVITTEQLGEAMTYAANLIGHKVDIYGSDACLMGMAEVANEMVNSVSIFAGSQEVEPGAGWSYTDLLSSWEANKDKTPIKVARILAQTYVDSYNNGSNGYADVTFSAFDLSKLAAFDQAVARLGENIRTLAPRERKQLIAAAGNVQTFAYRDYADVIHFMEKISEAKIAGIDAARVNAVKNTAKRLIVANKTSKRYAHANGLSIWLPLSPWLYHDKATRYANLQFNLKTQWNDTLGFIEQGIDNQNS